MLEQNMASLVVAVEKNMQLLYIPFIHIRDVEQHHNKLQWLRIRDKITD